MTNLYTLDGSEPAMAADSNLFSVPATRADRLRVEEERIGPVSAAAADLPATGDLNFFIPASSHGLIALPELSFEFELSIKKKKPTEQTWKRIVEEDKVAPVNLIAHSIFQSCQVSLCNRVISDTSCHYPYRAMMEILVNYGRDAARSQLTSAGFYMDTPGHHEDVTGLMNEGERARKKLFTDTEWVEFSGKVYSDVTDQMKNLVTGVPVHIRYTFNRPEFYLRTYTPAGAMESDTNEYRIFIQNPRLLVKRYIGTPVSTVVL